LFETKLDFILWWIGRQYWKFVWRWIPAHRYNVIYISSLPATYHDPSERILHASFHELTKWYEYNNSFEYEEEISALYDSDSEHYEQKLAKEVKELYDWWKVGRPRRMHKEDVFLRAGSSDEWYQLEQDGIAEDVEMLKRLAGIHKHIWYV